MKKIIILLLISMSLAFLASCSKKDDNSNPNSGDPNLVIGTWEATGLVTLTLNAGYTAQISHPGDSSVGTWQFDGKQITLITADSEIYAYEYVDANTLDELDPDTGKPDKIVLHRKP